MDILNNYLSAKAEMRKLSNLLFDQFTQNDLYGLIKKSDISYLSISDHKDNDLLVIIELYNYNDTLPKLQFQTNRDILEWINDPPKIEYVVEVWHMFCVSHLEKMNSLMIQKFLKTFTQHDHIIIETVIKNYEQMVKEGKSDVDIGIIAAKSYTNYLKNSLQ